MKLGQIGLTIAGMATLGYCALSGGNKPEVVQAPRVEKVSQLEDVVEKSVVVERISEVETKVVRKDPKNFPDDRHYTNLHFFRKDFTVNHFSDIEDLCKGNKEHAIVLDYVSGDENTPYLLETFKILAKNLDNMGLYIKAAHEKQKQSDFSFVQNLTLAPNVKP